MRVAWLTDVHLDHGPLPEFQADALIVTGDISTARRLADHLDELERRAPLYFVLGNHDYYYGSIDAVRRAVPHWSGTWLHQTGPQTIGRWQLVGVDGWGDGRIGNPETPIHLNDFVLIDELAGLGRAELLSTVATLGQESAARLADQLRHPGPHVIVATHVPPFRQACWHEGGISDDDWLPWFTCTAVGEVLLATAKRWPDSRFEVLCGHTHSAGTYQPRANLVVHTGAAEYGAPTVSGWLDPTRTELWRPTEADPAAGPPS